jgi:NAD(P)-dependent dehydrogenase (short-subunit alcohol dehydrogenase family)
MLDKAGHGCFAGCYCDESMAVLRSECKNVVPVRLDVTNADSVALAAATIAKHTEGRGLDGVVNNAGILISPGPVEWISVDSVERMLKVNVVGTVSVTKSVLPLIRQAHGRIVNVASIAGRVGLPANGGKCARTGVPCTLLPCRVAWHGVMQRIAPPSTPSRGFLTFCVGRWPTGTSRYTS